MQRERGVVQAALLEVLCAVKTRSQCQLGSRLLEHLQMRWRAEGARAGGQAQQGSLSIEPWSERPGQVAHLHVALAVNDSNLQQEVARGLTS